MEELHADSHSQCMITATLLSLHTYEQCNRLSFAPATRWRSVHTVADHLAQATRPFTTLTTGAGRCTLPRGRSASRLHAACWCSVPLVGARLHQPGQRKVGLWPYLLPTAFQLPRAAAGARPESPGALGNQKARSYACTPGQGALSPPRYPSRAGESQSHKVS